jgi:hypothetical protein
VINTFGIRQLLSELEHCKSTSWTGYVEAAKDSLQGELIDHIPSLIDELDGWKRRALAAERALLEALEDGAR